MRPPPALTRVNDRLLTPEYAAPEQILGHPVTTACDAYALGALLYELLTGRRPFVAHHPADLELERLICCNDPQRPSMTIQRAIDDSPEQGIPKVAAIAAARSITPERLARRLRGDLDAICLRALRKEPQQRYGSVEQLANDVRRYLANKTVSARQRTWLYRSQRFMRRHTWGVGAATACVLLVGAFAVMTSLQAQRIAAGRDRATQERARAETVSNFMLDVFEATDPVTPGREVTARELLDQAAQRIDSRLTDQREVRVRLLRAIAKAYSRQGQFARAIDYLERAFDVRKHLPEKDDSTVAGTYIDLAMAQRSNGQLLSSDISLRAAATLLNASPHRSDPARARLLAAMGRLYLDRSDWREGKKVLVESARLMRISNAQEPFALVEVLRDLSGAQFFGGDALGAEKTAREAVALGHASLPALHPVRVSAESQLAEVLVNLGGADEEATRLLENLLAARRVLYGALSVDVADTLDLLAKIRERQGQQQQAEEFLREALDIRVRTMGPDHFLTGYQHTSLGAFLWRRARPIEAERELRAALSIFARSLPPDHQYIASAEYVLGESLIAQGRYREAETTLIAARDRGLRSDAPAWRAARITSALGEAIYRQHRVSEGEQLLLAGYRGVMSDAATNHETRERARARLIRFHHKFHHAKSVVQLAQSTS